MYRKDWPVTIVVLLFDTKNEFSSAGLDFDFYGAVPVDTKETASVSHPFGQAYNQSEI